MAYLEQGYTDNMNIEQTVLLVLDALNETKIGIHDIEIVQVEDCYVKFSKDKIKKFMEKFRSK